MYVYWWGGRGKRGVVERGEGSPLGNNSICRNPGSTSLQPLGFCADEDNFSSLFDSLYKAVNCSFFPFNWGSDVRENLALKCF